MSDKKPAPEPFFPARKEEEPPRLPGWAPRTHKGEREEKGYPNPKQSEIDIDNGYNF